MKNYFNCFLLLSAICLIVSSAVAQDFSPIRFEFDGPDVPSEWNPGAFPNGSRQIIDSSYVITAPTDFGGASSDFNFHHTDLAVETQLRFLPGGNREDYASILLRSTDGVADGYSASVSSAGNLLISRVTPSSNVDAVVQATASGVAAVDEDLKMRLVASGTSINLFAWPATDPIPATPTLSLPDHNDRYLSGNEISLVNSSFQDGTASWPIAFRYVEISPVPEANSGFSAAIGIGVVAVVSRRRRVSRSIR